MLEIRPLTSHTDFSHAEEVQRRAWNIPDIEVVPVHLTHALQRNGACLLGAFVGEEMVGFSFGVLAFSDLTANKLKLYSVMSGVVPEYQDQAVGYQLKIAQRAFALEQGLELITWTYDPLESRNGRFNIHKLGATCRTYHRNYHGDLQGINAGLPTDRFEAEWWITSEHVVQRLSEPQPSQPAPPPSDSLILSYNSPIPPVNTLPPQLLVEIPVNFQALKQVNFTATVQWREHMRQLFELLFAHGYRVVDFVYEPSNGRSRSFYLLS